MKQDVFQARHHAEWLALEQWLDRRARPKHAERHRDAQGLLRDVEFPESYRRACQHLALAQRRGYSAVLIERLHELVQRGHLVLYRPPPPRWQKVVEFVVAGFPRLVRSEWRAMAVSAVLFFVPLVLSIAVLQVRPELVHTVFDPHHLGQIEGMYDPDAEHGKLGRDSGSDLEMFGFYVMNNVSIGFRTFAFGLLAGVGPVYVLVMNGVMIGTVAGHLTAIGYGEPFWRFVVGHSGPELLAIVIAGGAGLQIGMALIAPGRRTRGRALVEAGKVGGWLALGVFAMLVFAAFVEAYWSSIGWISNGVKFTVGGGLWLLLLAWLALGGRARAGGAG